MADGSRSPCAIAHQTTTTRSADHTAHLYSADPKEAPPGTEVLLRGDQLTYGLATPIAALPVATAIGAPGVPAAVSDAAELQVEVGQRKPGTTIHLQILRDGKDVSVPVTLADIAHRREEVSENTGEHGKARWGLGLADLTPDSREQIQAPNDVKGALIEQVQPGSSAEDAGLQPGDVILEVNRHTVQSAADVKQDLGKVPAGQNALLLIWSNGGNSFRVLHPMQG